MYLINYFISIRFYKYSKTTTNSGSTQNLNHLPSFGEIYRNSSSSHYNTVKSSSGLAASQRQQQQQFQSPIIEMPATPSSTMKSTRQRTQSFGDNMASSTYRATATAGGHTNINNGPIITPLSPTASDMNLNGYQNGYSTAQRSQSAKQNYSAYSSSKQQYHGSKSSVAANAAAAQGSATATVRGGVSRTYSTDELRKAQSCNNLEGNGNNNASSYSYIYSSTNNGAPQQQQQQYQYQDNIDNRFVPIHQAQQSASLPNNANRGRQQYGSSQYEYRDEYNKAYPAQHHYHQQTLISNQI